MNCKINWDEGVFAVPDKVADGLKLASAKSLRLLLYYLKNRKFPDDPADIGAGADDIEDAVNYCRGFIPPAEDGARWPAWLNASQISLLPTSRCPV